jgi:hypothetical protein
MPQRRITRRHLLAGVGLLPLTAACGGEDFQYKISGDRAESEQRVISGEGRGTTMTHEALLKLQEDYAKKAQEAEAAKSAAGG